MTELVLTITGFLVEPQIQLQFGLRTIDVRSLLFWFTLLFYVLTPHRLAVLSDVPNLMIGLAAPDKSRFRTQILVTDFLSIGSDMGRHR